METKPRTASAPADEDATPPYTREAADVVAELGSDATSG
jgi:hypothetical protein